ncbi:MAG: glycosyl hydrolase family 28-related protein [Ginsengibacter sp.]
MKIVVVVIFIVFRTLSIFANGIINVKDFGALGNGVNDDTKSIQAAINAAPSFSETIIYFPAGVYNIASYTKTNIFLINYCIKFHSNLYIKGEGSKSVIRLADHLFDKKDTSANAHLFYGADIKNISISDLMIDMNGGRNLVPLNVIKNNAAIFAYGGENYYIHDITIKNCSGTNMLNIMKDGKSLIVENCRFINGGNYVGIPVANKGQIDFSFVYSEWDSTIVKNNIFQQQNIDIALANYCGGIELHGSNSTASNNSIEGCWPAIYITSSKRELENIIVESNKFLNCTIGLSFWVNYPMRNILIHNNTIHLAYPRSGKIAICAGIIVPNGNAKKYNINLANAAPIYDLQITGNTIEADSMQELSAGMVLHSLHQSKISGNAIKGMNYGGIVLQGSKWGTDSLSVDDNSFIDFRPNNDKNAVAGYFVVTDTYSNGMKNSPGYKGIVFSRNKFIRNKIKNAKNNSARGKFLGAFIAIPSRMKGEIKFENNDFMDPSEKIHFVKTD